MNKKNLKEVQIERLLKKMGRSARIPLLFRAKMWFRLRGKARELKKPGLSPFFTWKKSLASAVAVIFIFTGATSAYAYTSPSVTNGTRLYPVKRVIEKIEEKFQKTEEERVNFHTKMMERRIAESRILAEKGIDDQETLEMISDEFNQGAAIAQMAEKAERKIELLEKIREKLTIKPVMPGAIMLEKTETVQKAPMAVPEPPKTREEALEKIENRIKKHLEFIEMKLQEPRPVQPPAAIRQPQPTIQKLQITNPKVKQPPIRTDIKPLAPVRITPRPLTSEPKPYIPPFTPEPARNRM